MTAKKSLHILVPHDIQKIQIKHDKPIKLRNNNHCRRQRNTLWDKLGEVLEI